MSWWALLRFHLLHVWRSRLLLLWFAFSLFVQYALATLMHSATLQYQQVQTFLGLQEVVTGLLYAQYFSGTVLAAVYGIWVVPYLHEESRSALTYSLPVSKWVFPPVYASGFGLLYAVQFLALALSVAVKFGPGVFLKPEFPLALMLQDAVLSLLALQVWVFLMALLGMAWGKVSAFLGAIALGLVLQVSAALFQGGIGTEGLWHRVYQGLPPFGELAFHLKTGFSGPGVGTMAALFAAWLLVFAGLFRWKLGKTGG